MEAFIGFFEGISGGAILFILLFDWFSFGCIILFTQNKERRTRMNSVVFVHFFFFFFFFLYLS